MIILYISYFQSRELPPDNIGKFVDVFQAAGGDLATIRFIQWVLMYTTNSGVGVPLLCAVAKRPHSLLSAVEEYVGCDKWKSVVERLCSDLQCNGTVIDERCWSIIGTDRNTYVTGNEQDRLLGVSIIGDWVGITSAAIRKFWGPYIKLLMVSPRPNAITSSEYHHCPYSSADGHSTKDVDTNWTIHAKTGRFANREGSGESEFSIRSDVLEARVRMPAEIDWSVIAGGLFMCSPSSDP